MIISASEMRKNQTINEEMQTAIKRVMRDITRAKDSGKTYCVFDPGGWWLYEGVKREFEKAGYDFRPLGYCGGIRQDGHYIMW